MGVVADDLLGVGCADALLAVAVRELVAVVGGDGDELVDDERADPAHICAALHLGEQLHRQARLLDTAGELARAPLLLQLVLLLELLSTLLVGDLLRGLPTLLGGGEPVGLHALEQRGLVVLGDAAGLLLASVHRLRTGLGQVGVRADGGGLLVLAAGHEGLLIVGCES